MIQIPRYNPIDFTQEPRKRSPWEIYDDFTKTFYKSKADYVPFLFRADNDGRTYRADVVTPSQRVAMQVNAELLTVDARGYRWFIVKIPIEDLRDGAYYVRVMTATAPIFSVAISRLFCVKNRPSDYDEHLTLSVSHRDNRNGIWQGFYPQMHLPFDVKDTSETRTDSTVFEMSFGRRMDLNTETFSARLFRFGGKKGVSRYYANAIRAWLYCSEIYIDGDKYTRHSDPEFITLDNYDLITVSCEMVKEDSMLTDANLLSPVHGNLIWRRPENIWTGEQIWLT